MVLPLFFPLVVSVDLRFRKRRRIEWGRFLRLIQIRSAAPSLERSRLLVYGTLVCQVSSYRPAIGSSDFLNETNCRHGSPSQVPKTQSAFHPLAQRNAVRRRDVRLQSSLFACAKLDVIPLRLPHGEITIRFPWIRVGKRPRKMALIGCYAQSAELVNPTLGTLALQSSIRLTKRNRVFDIALAVRLLLNRNRAQKSACAQSHRRLSREL
jgi:hypothetical protein